MRCHSHVSRSVWHSAGQVNVWMLTDREHEDLRVYSTHLNINALIESVAVCYMCGSNFALCFGLVIKSNQFVF